MLIVDGRLVSDEILAEEFVCNLRACKGACCHEGDYGAPLAAAELPVLEEIYPAVAPFLSERGRAEIEQRGLYEFLDETQDYATPCIDGGDCVYMVRTPEGFAACGIELAHRAGATDFKKPLSCELYPIRVERDGEHDFEALNYDRWEICSAACTLGRELRVPVFRFVREALVRAYGQGFYDQLEAAARELGLARAPAPEPPDPEA